MAKRRRRSGTGLYLVRASTGIYQIRGTVFGQSVRETTRTTDLKVAEQVRAEVERKIQSSKLHGPASVATFIDATADYLDENPGLEDQDRRLVRRLVEHFGATLLSAIDQQAVQKAAKALYPDYTPNSVDRVVYTPLVAIMRLAAFNRKCSLPLYRRPKKTKTLIKNAPDEWVRAFLDGCTHKKLKAMVWLMTTTGCRVTETCSILWRHVDLARGTALIEKTKNDDPRNLPIQPDLLAFLVELRAEGDDIGPVFGYSDRVSVNNAIKRECARRGLPYYSTHKLGRHAIATRMLNAGHTCKEVADAVGWKKVQLVYDNYGHLEKSKVQQSMLDVSKGLVRKA